MVPSFSMRSRRMICMGSPSLLHEVGQEADVPGALDRLAQLTLLLGRNRGDAARDDLATLGHEALQETHVLVVDLGRVLARERAGLAAAEKRTGHGLCLLAVAATGALAVVLAHLDRRAGFELVHAH